jgi:hypothetical protein
MSSGALTAVRSALTAALAVLKEDDLLNDHPEVANLEEALAAFDGCDLGDFVPAYPAEVLTAQEWSDTDPDFKDGDPAAGTASVRRRDLRSGDGEMRRCIVISDGE